MALEHLLVSQYADLLSHSRFYLNLRSQEGRYHPLILFRLSPGEHVPKGRESELTEERQLYAMEANCPHLGADMSHAEIEECETGVVAVCPWHRYDFDLRTGKSETGLKACTYAIDIRKDESGREEVWVEAPEGGTGWKVVELRAVSEEFADPSPALPDVSRLTMSDAAEKAARTYTEEDIIPPEGAPTTLMQWAAVVLNTPDPRLKVERTKHAVHLFRTGQLKSIGHRSAAVPRPPDVPPRDEAYMRSLLQPADAGKQRRNSRVKMLHALANAEQWAIDLAWDIMLRYGPAHPELPPAFFADFAKMALDESKHFTLLLARMAALAPGTAYGSLPVHAALWDAARLTSSSLRARLAIIHLVHEARGLDVNPGTIERFRRAGDGASVGALEVIHRDEVTHVTTGHRWFSWICAKEGCDPVGAFREEVRRCWAGELKGPFNEEARGTAGMTPDYYTDLRGDMSR